MSYTFKLTLTFLLALSLVFVNIFCFWNLFQSTQHDQKQISWHQEQPATTPGSWVTHWSGPGPCSCHCCWCKSGSSEPCSSKLIMVKNIDLGTKINLLWFPGAMLHLLVALDQVVGNVVGVVCVVVHLAVLKPVPVNSSWSKTFIWTPISTFYDA